MRWAFDPGNPQDRKAPAGDSTYVRSTPNSWAPMSYDPAMNTVFLPMGSRPPTSMVSSATSSTTPTALRCWRWTPPPAPEVGVPDRAQRPVGLRPADAAEPDRLHQGRRQTVPALVIGTKAGQIYVLDRATGKPLTKSKKYRSSRATSRTSPTRHPAQIGGHAADRRADPDRIGHVGRHPFDQLLCRIDFKKMRYDGLYTAPGTDLSLSFPGSLGGMNWGSLHRPGARFHLRQRHAPGPVDPDDPVAEQGAQRPVAKR
jgi:quinate dehydrogenase (quinone)